MNRERTRLTATARLAAVVLLLALGTWGCSPSAEPDDAPPVEFFSTPNPVVGIWDAEGSIYRYWYTVSIRNNTGETIFIDGVSYNWWQAPGWDFWELPLSIEPGERELFGHGFYPAAGELPAGWRRQDLYAVTVATSAGPLELSLAVDLVHEPHP